MMTFLFWNTKNRRLERNIANLARQYQVDVFMFAEYNIPSPILLSTFTTFGQIGYYEVPIVGCTKIQIFTRFSPNMIPPIQEEDRITIRHLRVPNSTDILLAITHFPDKLSLNSEIQAMESTEYSRLIREAERQVGHMRTILVGDLNMHPFDLGIVGAQGFNGVMSRQIAERGQRKVYRPYPFFYNPMWNLLGDANPGPPGTFYRNSADNNFFWNMYDQVLVRPNLLSHFNNADLKILDSDGEISFLSKTGLPDAKVASDHLPILFRLSL